MHCFTNNPIERVDVQFNGMMMSEPNTHRTVLTLKDGTTIGIDLDEGIHGDNNFVRASAMEFKTS